MKNVPQVVSTALVGFLLLGTTYSQLTVKELYFNADFVGLLQITEASILGAGDDTCGALYTGKIIDQFKGDPKTTIKFGHDQGLWFGAEYLVFLKEPGQIHRSLRSTNSVLERIFAERRERCAPRRTGWQIMHSGFAALISLFAEEFDDEPTFAVPYRYVTFPDELPSPVANFGFPYEFSDMRWVKRDSALSFLRTLNK